MSCLIASETIIAAAHGLTLDLFDNIKHKIIDIPSPTALGKGESEADKIVDIIISSKHDILALITSTSKRLILIEVSTGEIQKTLTLQRNASKVRFTTDDKHILIADKSGDVYLYNLKEENHSEDKLLGHLSLLLDILQTNDKKFIITSDRDEKIKVSCYPNTYNIQTYCLGHKEFVNHLEVIEETTLISTSGDGTVKFWNYVDGSLLHTIYTDKEIQEPQVKEEFINSMDKEGIQVTTLPIVDFAIEKVEESYLIALTLYNLNNVYLYLVNLKDGQIIHNKLQDVPVSTFPTSLQLVNNNLYVYSNIENVVNKYTIDTTVNKYELKDKIQMFGSKLIKTEQNHEAIRMLYKRKFDNVQEYQERKKLRLLNNK